MVSTCCYQSWMFDYNVCMKVFLLCLQWLSTSILSSSSYSSCSKGFSTTWSQVVSIRTECLLTISAWNSSFYVCKGCWHQCFHHLSTIHVLNFFNNMVSTCCYQNWMFAYDVCMKIFLFCWQGLLIPILPSSCYSSCSKGFSTTWSQLVAIRTECLLTMSAWKSSFFVCFWYQYIHHLLTVHVLNVF